MGTFLYSGKDKAAKGVRLPSSFICAAQHTEEIYPPLPLRLREIFTPTLTCFPASFTDCAELYDRGVRSDGAYIISPDGRCPFRVYCDMTNGGWTLIQKRQDGSVNFYRPWDEYVAGFGDIVSILFCFTLVQVQMNGYLGFYVLSTVFQSYQDD